MTDIEKFNIVVSTIDNVLKELNFDDNRLLACTLDDHGNCIHATISGSIDTEGAKAISTCFGDDDSPAIYAIDKDKLQIVFIQNKGDLTLDCLLLEASFEYHEETNN